ncbi:MAG: ATP-binding cassette domain-containing protein [Clostridiales bacterium]|nr:ATP-binding cassette domain-containing protein [Clostridiales bacterium]
MFRLFKNLKPVLGIFILAVILLASGAMAELYLPGMMSDIINDGIFLDYEPMYEHETMLNPFGEIDITGDMEGFERDTIPVFEMKDGFSTADLKTVWNERFNSFAITFDFMDIPVKDSRELFNEILLPFMDSLKDYQMYKIQDKYRQKYNDPTIVVNDYIEHYEEEDKEMVKMAIGKLIDYESLLNAKSSSINIKTFLTIYDQDSDEKDSSSVWDNEDAKRLLTSAVLCMKHSENGNLLPIPTMLDENGNTVKVAVNAYGQALDKSQLTYVYDEEILRYTPFPDYEIILCNKVLGYAYKYENGQKWIRNRLGMNQKDIDIAVGENTEESTGFKRLLEIISLSKVGTTTATLSQKEDKTAEEWLTPDGITVQTANMSFIIDRGVKMLLLTLFASACVIVAMFFSSKIVSFFSKILRSKVFTKVESFSLVEFDKFSTASLVTRSTNDINQIQNVFLMILRTTLSAPVTIIGGFIFSFRANVSMTMVLVYILPILFIAAGVAAKICQPLFKVIQKKVDQLTLIMREGITGIRVVRAFNKQELEKERFNKVNVSVTKTAVVLQRYTAVLVPLINICLNCASVGIFWRAAKQVADKSITDVGKMLEVSQYITQIAMAMVFVASAVVVFPRASASAERILQILDTDVDIQDKPDAQNQSDGSGTIEFDNVSFKYCENAENNILEGISFKCEKGKVTAIVGGTGSGKSSVINLIPRFYDISSGSLKVDGQEVSTYPMEDLRKKLGFVPQRSMLFSGTIADNLRYGKEDATEEEMWEALRIAQSDTFVREKEGQLEHIVEQGGQNFSGGQKQRLSIARAIIRRPDIYIFDDSFSALDFKTDSKLRQALKSVTQNSITIIVAQRIGTIMDADEIIVLDNGRIRGKGKHEYLIRNCQVYRDIALSQMSEEELGL